MKKTLIAFMTALSVLTSSVCAFAYDPSFWAADNVQSAMNLSIISEQYSQKPYTDPISRLDFSNVAVNLYASITAENVSSNAVHPFVDTTDVFPNMAYYAGIISGDGMGYYHPYDTLTRQEMCKIISNTLAAAGVLPPYTMSDTAFDSIGDEHLIADWAKPYVAFMLDEGLMAGYWEDNNFHPLDNVTREQAAIVANRCYVRYGVDVNGQIKSALVAATDSVGNAIQVLEKTVITPAGRTITLAQAHDPNFSDETIAQENPKPSGDGGYAPSGTPLQTPDENGLYALKTYSETLASGEAADKEYRIFGGGTRYASREEAEPHMTDVTVQVWKLDETTAQLYPSTMTFKVNAVLRDDVIAIFDEIFASPQMPPIKDISCYAWRSVMSSGSFSDHNYGTAIDINYNENYSIYKNGTQIGSLYAPFENVYSMPETGIIIQTFAKYGWLWGGNAWVSGTKEYMHLTYLGK